MKMRQIPRLIASLGLSALAVNAWAQQQAQPAQQPVVAVTQLQQLVERAITTHPEINARYHDFVSSLEDQNVARAAWRPQVTASGWVGQEWRSSSNNAPSYDWSRPGWNLELRQLIFDGGATTNRIGQFGFEKLSKYYDLQATSNSLANEAVAAYLDVQRYRDMQALANENFTMHLSTLKQIRDRQQAGVGRGVDLDQASGRLSLAQSNLMTESNNLNDVTQRYRRLIGELPPAEMEAVPEAVAGLPVIGQTENFADSLRVNPTLLSKQALVQAAEAGNHVAKAAFAPTLDFRASTGKDREQPGNTTRDAQTSRVQLMLTYPLYRGGADSARLRQTAAQSYAAVDVRDYTCRNVQQELSIAWNNIQRLREQLPFLREHELSTSKVRVAFQQQFGIGQRSLLDLLDTENELFDARRALLNAEFDLKKAQYYWLTLSNQVLPTLGLAQPHNQAQPAEQQDLVLPQDPVMACADALPDTSNLTPLIARN